MHQVPQYDYKILCADLFKKLLIILGRDITVLTALRVPEIQLSPNGQIQSIQGDPQLIFDKLVSEFRELSPYVIDHVTHELHLEHEKKTNVDNGLNFDFENNHSKPAL